jgi:hypothetical protein
VSYQDYQSKLGPPWLRRDVMRTFEEQLGAEKDDQLDAARQAVLASIPGQGPVDALVHQGADRLLPRAAGETDDDYGERLRTVWDSPEGWSFAASYGGLLRALARAGFPTGVDGANVVQRVRRYAYLDGDSATGTVTFGTHATMTFDASPPWLWHQFAIVFGADVADLEEGSELADLLNETVRIWKPAKAWYVGAWVLVGGKAWGWPPGIAWGDGTAWGDGAGVNRYIPPR